MNRTRVALGAGIAVVVLAGVAIGGFALLQGGGATPTSALGAPQFVDETAESGIDHTYGGGTTAWVGGGVAVFDCDSDGRPDLYLAGGTGTAGLYRNASPVGGPLRFTPVHDPATDLSDVNGAYPVDIDGDGQVDLAVLRVGENVMLRGLGDCRFERANETWGIDGGDAWTTAFSATWEGDAALPTLAFGHYLGLDADRHPVYDCADNELVRPNASGTGYDAPTILTPGYCTLSALFSDWGRSGRRDLRFANDREYYSDGQDQLWRIEDGAAPRLYTDQDGWVAIQIWGMGIASYDLTHDAYPEVYLTSQGDNKLQTLTSGPAQPTYRDIALKRGVNAAAPYTGGDVLPSTAWHPEFDDVNNDGFIDLFVSKGNVSEQPDHAQQDPSNLFLGQPDGTFVEGAQDAGIVEFDRGRGAALVDLDLDGRLDLVEVKLDAPARLWHNVRQGDPANAGSAGHWLAISLRQPGGNRDAIGALIEVQVGDVVMRREVTVGGGHIGGELGPIHFGLGPAGEVRVRIQWPDGEVGPWLTVKADQRVEIERGADQALPLPSPAS